MDFDLDEELPAVWDSHPQDARPCNKDFYSNCFTEVAEITNFEGKFLKQCIKSTSLLGLTVSLVELKLESKFLLLLLLFFWTIEVVKPS